MTEGPSAEAPAGHRCKDAPGSAPSGQPLPDTAVHGAGVRCGAVRRGRCARGCDPCSRLPPDIAGRLRQAGFYRREPIQRALATYDLGLLFWAVRQALELTQVQLGEVLGLDQKRISQIERGQRPLTGSFQVLARVATRLGIPPALLGLCCCPDSAGMAAQPAAPAQDEAGAAHPDRAGE